MASFKAGASAFNDADTTTNNTINIGLLIPLHGPIGLWGLSCEYCARLAVAELNSYCGILGQEVRLITIDAGSNPQITAAHTLQVIEEQKIHALVGMHTSDIRKAIIERVGGRIPYIYTPMYEGGEAPTGVFMSGQTPAQQVLPMLDWLTQQHNAKSWFFLGNNYIWPYITNRTARRHLQDKGMSLHTERYVPFAAQDFQLMLDDIEAQKPDVVVVNLLGECSVRFNRQFAERGLDSNILRYCGALEENMLYAMGSASTNNMMSSLSYYEALDSGAAQGFSKLYYASFGDCAPSLNQFSISCYEGVMFLANLAEISGSLNIINLERAADQGLTYWSPRGEITYNNKTALCDSFIVQVDQNGFRCLEKRPAFSLLT